MVAFDKAKGTFFAQYRLAGGSPALTDVRGMFVVLGPATGAPSTLYWATKDSVMSAVLEAVADSPATSPGASGSPGPSGGASPKASGKATRAP